MLSKKNLGPLFSIFISLSPLVIWSLAMPLNYRFSSVSSLLTSLGQISGLTGMAMFSVVLVLSTRMKKIEDYFGGMNFVYIWHAILGGISLILLLGHPLFLAFSMGVYSMNSAANFLLPGLDLQTNLGIIGLLLMMSLLIITFYKIIPYHFWRFTHKFLGFVFIIGAIHGFFIPSDISRFFPLRIYMLFIVGAGIAAFIYKTLLGRFLVGKSKYIVNEVSLLKDNVVRITLSPEVEGKGIAVSPGQFIFISFISKNISDEMHPFSISAIYPDGKISISAKELGDYTLLLKNVQPDDRAMVEGGFGRFNFRLYSNKKQVWIAGGIGVAPFISMAQVLVPDYSIDFFYSVRTPDEAVYLEDLEMFARSNPNFLFHPFFTKTQGRLTADEIAKDVKDLKICDYFLCGPPSMMKGLRTQLRKVGVPDINIHSEEFSL